QIRFCDSDMGKRKSKKKTKMVKNKDEKVEEKENDSPRNDDKNGLREVSTLQKEKANPFETMKKHILSFQRAVNEYQRDSNEDNALIGTLQRKVDSLVESQSEIIRRFNELMILRQESTIPPKKKVNELTKNVDEQWKEAEKEILDLDWVCCRKVEIILMKKKLAISLLNEELLKKQIAVTDAMEKNLRSDLKNIKGKLSMCQQATAKTSDGNDEYIYLRLVGQDSRELHYRVKKEKCPWIKIKSEYAGRVGVPLSSLRFLYMGREIKDEDTPKCLGMKENDYIDVYQV
ncbi:hypothetical protein PMAYCL1PPCAC_03227, partial [Pristionchus mayeri]